MSGETELDLESLKEAGKVLVDVAEQFAEALTGFQSELDGFGQPWGDDDIGMLIGTAYAEVAEWAFECYGEAAEEIAAAGDDLDGMATAYDEIEKTVDGMLKSMQGKVE